MTKFNISTVGSDADMNDIGDEGVGWLVQCPWSNLEAINLSTNQIYIGRNNLTPVAAEVLKKANWPNLMKLDITANNLGPQGVFHLQQCRWPNLKEILLEKNEIGGEGALHLVNTDWPNLESLNLSIPCL